jgi:hypothetical protein
MLKKRCALFIALIMVVMTMMGTLTAFATEVDTTVVSPVVNPNEDENGQTENNTGNQGSGEYDTGVPDVTLDEFEAKVEGKFYKVIKLMQTGAKPVCVIFFIIGALMSVVGLMGKGGAWKGMLVMGLSALAYTAIMYAPEIVQFIQEWTVS